MSLPAGPVPMLASHQLLVFLLQVALLLAAAAALGALATRLGLPAVAGELLAGVLIGPSLLGHLAPGLTSWLFPHTAAQAHLLDAVGQLGAILLVGVTGADLDTRTIRPVLAKVGRIGALSLVIPFGLGLACGFLVPSALLPPHIHRYMFSLLLAVALSVSAMPVIAKTLSDMRLIHRDLGQLILTTATVDDAVAWFGLSVVSAMAVTGLTAAKLGVSALYLGGFVAAAIVVGRPAVRLAATRSARYHDPAAALTVLAFLVILLGGAITDALGFEPVFGAFVAGTLLTAADVSRVVLARLRTFVMAVLAPLFLASAGLRMDLTVLWHPVAIMTTLALIVIAVIGKFAGGYAGGRISRLGVYESMAVGSGLNSRGVVQIVIALAGLRLGLFSPAVYTILLVIAVGTSIMAAPMLRFSMQHIAEHEHEQRRRAELSPVDQLEAATGQLEAATAAG
jgi:Kef-type K+ transport system membrane component KefB